MRTRTKDEVVLRCGIRLALGVQPTLGLEYMWVLVDVGVMEGWVNRGDDHAVVRYCILVVDREGFGGFVRYLTVKGLVRGSIARAAAYHRDRWLQPEALLNHGPEVMHVVNHLESDWALIVSSTNAILFFANFGQNLGVIGKVLEHVDDA